MRRDDDVRRERKRENTIRMLVERYREWERQKEIDTERQTDTKRE